MRVLMLHNRYQVRGGEDESTAAEAGILREAGHHVSLLEADNRAIETPLDAAAAAISATWNQHWYRKTLDALREHRADILHVQNFFPQVSPAVYYAARAAAVPVVQAVRNYRLVCPSAMLFRSGRMCTSCVTHRLKTPAIIHRCYRGSAAGSAAVAAMLALHRFAGTWHRQVNQFLAVSGYVRDQLVAGGYQAARIAVKPNFAATRPALPNRRRRHLLYAGRISPEKGIDHLIEAHRLSGVTLPLRIVGGRPPAHWPVHDGVEWIDPQPLETVYRMMEEAVAVVIPSILPEPFGRVAVESFACGTPVVTSGHGGSAQVVEHEVTGLHYAPGDIAALAAALRRLADDSALAGNRRSRVTRAVLWPASQPRPAAGGL